MNEQVLVQQLIAMRALCDAIIMGFNGSQPVADPGGCPKCGADEDKIRTAQGMGGAKSMACSVCRHQWAA